MTSPRSNPVFIASLASVLLGLFVAAAAPTASGIPDPTSTGDRMVTQSLVGAMNEDDDRFGATLAVGDFNGDGRDDLAIGHPGEAPGSRPSGAGAVSVLYGAPYGLAWSLSESLTQELGPAVSENGDAFGSSLVAGRFNDDAFDDLAVGIPLEDYGAADAGAVLVFYGSAAGLVSASGTASTELLLQSTTGALNEASDRFGAALAAGDLDGDGLDELAVGVPYEDDGVADNGMVIVFYAGRSGLLDGSSVVQFARLGDASVGGQAQAGAHLGAALAMADFDGDGRDDLAMGLPQRDVSSTNDGQVLVVYGSSTRLLVAGSTPRWERFSQTAAGATNEAGDGFGSTLAAGDFDRDGRADLAVGVPGEDDEAANDGMVAVFYGSSLGLISDGFAVGIQRLGQEWAGAEPESGDAFGAALGAGDLNGDGHDDLVVGVPGEDWGGADDNGLVLVFEGGPAGLYRESYPRIGQSSLDGLEEDGDGFGSSVAVGDFDGNGDAELVAGAPHENLPGGRTDAGAVYVESTRPGPSRVRSLDQFYPDALDLNYFLDNVGSRYAIAQSYIIGSTGESPSRPLKAIKVSDNPTLEEDEPAFLFVGLIHGDEPLGVRVVLHLLENLTEAYSTNATVRAWVDAYEIWIVPLMNPYGYEQILRRNANNVDLNRNFPFRWDRCEETDNGPCAKGTGPASEAETQAWRAFVAEQRPAMGITFHSGIGGTVGSILRPWSTSDRGADQASGTADDVSVTRPWDATRLAAVQTTLANAILASRQQGILCGSAPPVAGGCAAPGTGTGMANGQSGNDNHASVGTFEYIIEVTTDDWNDAAFHDDLDSLSSPERARLRTAREYARGYVDGAKALLGAYPGPGVTGRVTDASGSPVAAEVRIASLDVSRNVDGDGDNDVRWRTADERYGRYTRLLPAGTYSVRFQALGFVTETRTVTVTAAGLVQLDVTLRP